MNFTVARLTCRNHYTNRSAFCESGIPGYCLFLEQNPSTFKTVINELGVE